MESEVLTVVGKAIQDAPVRNLRASDLPRSVSQGEWSVALSISDHVRAPCVRRPPDARHAMRSLADGRSRWHRPRTRIARCADGTGAYTVHSQSRAVVLSS